MPEGEERDRAMILGLHSRGDQRTPEEETLYRELIAKHGPASDPDFTLEVYLRELRSVSASVETATDYIEMMRGHGVGEEQIEEAVRLFAESISKVAVSVSPEDFYELVRQAERARARTGWVDGTRARSQSVVRRHTRPLARASLGRPNVATRRRRASSSRASPGRPSADDPHDQPHDLTRRRAAAA